MLLKTPLSDKASRTVGLICRGAARMSSLIDDVMDFARGRLGSGIALDCSATEPLEPVLRQIIAELQASFPDRSIDTTIVLGSSVICDQGRIAQLVSNLLANALTHGDAAMPI